MFQWNKLSIKKMAHKEAKKKQMGIETNFMQGRHSEFNV
jgi:hypothetical protein